MTAEPQLDRQCINTLRFLSVDMVQKANSGHPGLPLGAAPMAYVLWTHWLKVNPRNPNWLNRDRFVLSAGHGSALLYGLLHLAGYDLSLDDLRRFRQWGSKTPGHPERGHTPGVETTTGPLGQGFGNAVGMAIAEAQLAARYNRPGHALIDHHTYALVSDGDLMEGVASEAASLAGHLKLGKLTCLYDDNTVIFFEHRLLYPLKGSVPDEIEPIPLGKARIMRAGTDVTVVAIGRMVPEAMQAAEDAEQEGISVEVIDPRTLLPLDEEKIIASVKKTTRAVTAHEAVTRGGFGAELAAVIQQGAFDYLDAPIERVGAKFAPLAFAPAMEQWVVPHAADVLEAVKRTMARH